MSDTSLTDNQKEAVIATGNVLIKAGAGTGKTKTLVERCLHWLFHAEPRGSLDRLLMVTFTDAAATEMRERLRSALWKRCEDGSLRDHAQSQLALLDTAHIRTLHSFNLDLIRRHFLELSLDPQVSVLDEYQARMLQEEVLDELFDDYYNPTSACHSPEVCAWLKNIGVDAEDQVRSWLLAFLARWRSLADPQAWMEKQRNIVANPQPADWLEKLPSAFNDWADSWRGLLADLAHNPQAYYTDEPQISDTALQHAAAFAALFPPSFSSLKEVAEFLKSILEHNKQWRRGDATKGRQPIKKFLDEVETFADLLPATGGDQNVLREDWQYIRHWLSLFLAIVNEFDRRYAQAKRAQGALDFNDFEQFALKLLYEPSGQISPLASQWRQRFDVVLVDEYQDINPAQDAILRALSREGPQSNRTLVGDIKQSIYRFRQAAPQIFQQYADTWSRQRYSRVVTLSHNFRSAEAILQFVNELFRGLMIREVGGVEYDENAALQFGAPGACQVLTKKCDQVSHRIELLLVTEDTLEEAEEGEDDSDGGSADAERDKTASTQKPNLDLNLLRAEARMIGRRLLQLKQEKFPIWRRDTETFSPVEWRDMVILLRAPCRRTQAFVQEFAALDIPLRADTGNLLESQEVQDLLNVLRLLDNPRQDLPLLGVLRSPLVGLKLDDLAEIRLAHQKGSLWLAFQRWLEQAPPQAPADSPQARAQRFMDRFLRWRDLARRGSLVTCLETILQDTHLDAWCLAQPEGHQRHANVQRLLHLARHFDTLQRQGLHRFLQHVETFAELELPAESPQIAAENCVRLLSIHQSKGLEFPVVVVANLGAKFNFQDSREEILWEDLLGLCPRVRPPGMPPYSTLARVLARKRLQKEQIGEELRLLYVAFTRACDLLLLAGEAAPRHFKRWKSMSANPVRQQRVLQALCPLDWVGAWWLKQTNQSPPSLDTPQGANSYLTWQIHLLSKLKQDQSSGPESKPPAVISPQACNAWQTLWEWRYPALSATREPAKTHVSALRRRALGENQAPAEAGILPQARPPFLQQPAWAAQARGLQAGALLHLFLEQLDLAPEPTEEHLARELNRMQEAGLFTREETALLDLKCVRNFWLSDIGKTIRRHLAHVHREMPFTARFTAADLQQAGVPVSSDLGPDEFMVVQGVADLVVLQEKELWVLDYKIDRLSPAEAEERARFYEPQLRLYGLALSRIFRRPVPYLWLHFLSAGRTVPLSWRG